MYVGLGLGIGLGIWLGGRGMEKVYYREHPDIIPDFISLTTFSSVLDLFMFLFIFLSTITYSFIIRRCIDVNNNSVLFLPDRMVHISYGNVIN
jgi:hypothetical protein